MKKAEDTASTVTKEDVQYALKLSIESQGINPVALKSVQKMGKRYRVVLSSYFTLSDAKLIVDEMNTMMKTSFSISPDSWQKMGNGNKSFEMTETKMATGGMTDSQRAEKQRMDEQMKRLRELRESKTKNIRGMQDKLHQDSMRKKMMGKGGALKTSLGEYSWFFNWNEGGFNEVYAKTKAEAIKKATELGYPSYMPENQYALERSLQDVKDKYGQKAVDYIMNKVHSEGEWSNKLQKKLYPKLTLQSKGFSQGLTPKLSSFRKQSEDDSRQTTRMANMMSMEKGGGVGNGFKIGDKVEFSVPYFNSELHYRGEIIEFKGNYVVVEYENNDDKMITTQLDSSRLTKTKMSTGGNIETYVVVSKAPDGYLVVMSKPVSSKSEAQKLAKLTTAPKGEVISVMTTESVRSSKKVLGREYLADGGKMAFGGMVNDLSEGTIDRMEGLYPNAEMDTFLYTAGLIIEDMENEGFEKDEIISFLAHKMVERSRMQDTNMATGGGVSSNDQYCVVMAGGSIGERNGVFDRAMNKLVATFDMRDAEGKAREYAKRMNATLSPGEKKYYKIKYTAKKYDATKFAPREMKATGGNVESGAAHLYITLDKGDIKVYHGDDRKTVLLEKPHVSEGSWNKLWNCLRGL